jgi:acetyl-CoA synthetase
MSNNIESHLVENRVFKPAKAFTKKARIQSLVQYREMWEESVKRPDRFWAREAAELTWQQKWTKVLEWNEPYAQWFVGGKLNVSENCLDDRTRRR